MARIRTLNFLPEIFQTPTNNEFLSATLDRLVNDPETVRVQGYVGSKFGMGGRGQRFAMVVNDGTVEHLFVEAPGEFRVSSAEYMLEQL